MQLSALGKKLAVVAMTASLLVGCATTLSPEEIKKKMNTYVENHSFAFNISFRFMNSWPYDHPDFISDKYISDEEYEKTFGIKAENVQSAKPAEMTTGQLAAISGSMVALGGMSQLFGAGLLFLTTPIAPDFYQPRSFGFVPKTEAKTDQEAKQKYLDGLIDAFKKSLANNGYGNITVKHGEIVPRLSFDKEDTQYITTITAVNTKEATNAKVEITHFRKLGSGFEMMMPRWLDKDETAVWKINPCFYVGGGVYKAGKYDPISDYKLIGDAAKHLPKYTYLLMPNHPYAMGEDNKMKWTAPYLADNTNRYYFYMPKSMRWK